MQQEGGGESGCSARIHDALGGGGSVVEALRDEWETLKRLRVLKYFLVVFVSHGATGVWDLQVAERELWNSERVGGVDAAPLVDATMTVIETGDANPQNLRPTASRAGKRDTIVQ